MTPEARAGAEYEQVRRRVAGWLLQWLRERQRWRGDDLDDLMQEGLLGAYEALLKNNHPNRFQVARWGAKQRCWVWIQECWSVRLMATSRSQIRVAALQSATIRQFRFSEVWDEGQPEDLLEQQGGVADFVPELLERLDREVLLSRAWAAMTAKQQAAVALVYDGQLTLRAAAEQLGCHPRNVEQMVACALARARDALGLGSAGSPLRRRHEKDKLRRRLWRARRKEASA